MYMYTKLFSKIKCFCYLPTLFFSARNRKQTINFVWPNSNFTAATGRDAMFHTTPTVCYSVPSIEFKWLVEVANRSISICLRQRGFTIVK